MYFLKLTLLWLPYRQLRAPLTQFIQETVSPFYPAPDGNSAPSLASAVNHTTGPSKHVDFMKDIGGQGEVYAVETQTTSTWILNNPVKTKQNKTLWLPGPGEVLFIGCFALWVSHVISPSLPIAFLPHPHPTPNSKSSLCNAQPTCSLRPQPPDSAPDPSRCPADWKDLSLKSNPLFLDCHVGGQQTFYRPQLHLNIEIELRTCFVPDAEDTQNWKNAQARILKNLIINFLKNS